MARKPVRSYMASRRDARFLIKAIMGLLADSQNRSSDYVLSVVAAAIRGYSKGYSKRHDREREEHIYQTLKEYAREKSDSIGQDAELMENFLSVLKDAEEEIWGQPTIQRIFVKPCAAFPVNILSQIEETDFFAYAKEHFRGRFYCSEVEPRRGLLVFEDAAGLDEFGDWMKKTHPELSCPEFEDGSWKCNRQL